MNKLMPKRRRGSVTVGRILTGAWVMSLALLLNMEPSWASHSQSVEQIGDRQELAGYQLHLAEMVVWSSVAQRAVDSPMVSVAGLGGPHRPDQIADHQALAEYQAHLDVGSLLDAPGPMMPEQPAARE